MSGPDTELVIDATRLRQFTQLVFEKAGMRAADADQLADHLIWADLRGLGWLGVNKIPQYVARLRAGGTPADAEPAVVRSGPASVVVDGRDGFGQVVGAFAMRRAIEKAQAVGIGATVVRNTTSPGAMGYYPTLAIEQRMLGMAITNGPPLQPPPGGTEKVLGNQAFAVGSPAGRHPPLLLDMATSAITLVRIHEHQQRGELLPGGVALTGSGQPTVEPAAALAGILLPMAGHRGFGLALMWEVLTGILAGGTWFGGDVAWPDAHDRPQGVSLFLLAIDPTVSLPYETFGSRVDELIDRIQSSKPAAGADRVSVPGERSARTMVRRRRDGVPVPRRLLDDLRQLGADLGVPL